MSPWNPIANRSGRGGAGRLCAALLITALFAAPWPAASVRGQSDEERVEQFLARLGLVDLQVLHLEQALRGPLPLAQKQPIARRLADLYAERLMASADDKSRYDDTVNHITALLQSFPQANTTALQVMLLQADYNRAESLITAWMGDPQDTTAREEARQILTRITPQLIDHQQALNKEVDELAKQLEALPEGDLLQTKELESRRVQAIAARATYFAAWSNYYLALVTNAAEKAEPYLQARDIFLRLLGFDEGLPAVLEPEWLALESIWRARAVIGLGLSVAACGDLEGSERCFDVLEDASVPAEIQDQAPYWRVRALLGAGQLARVEDYARQQISRFQPPPTQGKVSLCVALVRAGLGDPAADRSPLQQALGNLGFNGLARLGQLSAINTLIEKYQIKPAGDAGFVLLWAVGQQQFAQAEKSKSTSDYNAAAETLQAALQSPEANTLAGPAARCRYTLGWCCYRVAQWEEAAREFSHAFPGLNESQDSLAVESAWMAFAAYRKLADTQPHFATVAADALKRLEQYFPTHPYAQRGRYEMNKLLEKTDPETMVRQLEAIAPTDENYPLARYDLCLLLHRLWTQQRGDPELAKRRLDALRSAADTYLQQVTTNTDAQRKLQVCLLAVDAALHHAPPHTEMATTLLAAAGRQVAELPDDHSQVIEYHYRLLEAAAAAGDTTQRRQQAQWLADHAAGSPYEQAALVIVANALDRDIGEAGPSDVAALNQQAYQVYRRLSDLLGASEQVLAGSKNAQIAASRLAHYAQQIGQPAAAAGLLEQLLKIAPRDRRYLERAATVHALAGQHEQALAHWRTLLAGLPAGSEAWYEAKYHQLESLGKTDKEQARKVFRQLALLHPDLGGESWQAKFTDLARSW